MHSRLNFVQFLCSLLEMDERLVVLYVCAFTSVGGWDSHSCTIITLPSHPQSTELDIEELKLTVKYLVTLPRFVVIHLLCLCASSMVIYE